MHQANLCKCTCNLKLLEIVGQSPYCMTNYHVKLINGWQGMATRKRGLRGYPSTRPLAIITKICKLQHFACSLTPLSPHRCGFNATTMVKSGIGWRMSWYDLEFFLCIFSEYPRQRKVADLYSYTTTFMSTWQTKRKTDFLVWILLFSISFRHGYKQFLYIYHSR